MRVSDVKKNSAKRRLFIGGLEPTGFWPRNDNGNIGAHSNYRREDYVFQREQSLDMRKMDWEERLPKVRHWGSNLVANLVWDVFAH